MTPQRSGAASIAVLAFTVLSCQFSQPGDGLPVSARRPAAGEAVSQDPVEARLAARAYSLSPREVTAVAEAIHQEAARVDISPDLVLAVIEVESTYDAFAVSPKGAMGLMQILPDTGKALARRTGVAWRGERTLFDPVANVTLGIAYLSELRERFGHWPTALAAYNWGPSHIGRRISNGVPIPAGYAERVLDAKSRRAAAGA